MNVTETVEDADDAWPAESATVTVTVNVPVAVYVCAAVDPG